MNLNRNQKIKENIIKNKVDTQNIWKYINTNKILKNINNYPTLFKETKVKSFKIKYLNI